MKLIDIAIVEDDLVEQQRLLQHLRRYQEEHQLVFRFSLYTSALDFLEEKTAFDIVFMDIMLPNMTGMEAAARLRAFNSSTVLIFVTMSEQYALKSYEVDALDYIIKPVTYQRLTMKLQKAIKVDEAASGGSIIINDARGVVKCATGDLLYVEVHGHKLDYHTKDGVYTAYGSLNDLERVLGVYRFMRCNSCYLVNPQHIKRIDRKEMAVVMSGDEALKISQTRRKQFISDLTNWLGQGKC